MKHFIVPPVFAVSHHQNVHRRDESHVYHVWMGPSLEDIVHLQQRCEPAEGYVYPQKISLPTEEILRKIRNIDPISFFEFMKDYDLYHHETAILLYSSKENIFPEIKL